jgi:hypothetical protein
LLIHLIWVKLILVARGIRLRIRRFIFCKGTSRISLSLIIMIWFISLGAMTQGVISIFIIILHKALNMWIVLNTVIVFSPIAFITDLAFLLLLVSYGMKKSYVFCTWGVS